MTTFALIPVVRQIVDALKPVLVFVHDTTGFGWGMSIVLLTLLVRTAMLPLTVKQFKSMQSMARVTPEIKALQAKYKDDKQRQQQELMKFYADNKVNPFAACLPLALQMPFFIGLFYLLRTDLRFEICGQALKPCGSGVFKNPGAEEFLFIPDLTDKATGWVLAVLLVLYIGSQLLSSILNTVTLDRNQRLLMYGLPFMFTVFIFRFPAGLIVYWITTNSWTVAQQTTLRKIYGPMRPPPSADDPAPVPAAPGSGGGLFARLSGAVPTTQASAVEAKPAPTPPPPPRKKKKRSGRRR